MYQKKLSGNRAQIFILASVLILALLAGCAPIPYPADQVPSPLSPLEGQSFSDDVLELANLPPDVLADLPPDSPEDMSRLLAHAQPFQCESDADNVLHCAANAPVNNDGFAARVYVKVPDQGYPTDVVLLPIYPPGLDMEDERAPSEIRSFFDNKMILNKADVDTDFKPAWLITNFAVVKVDENGDFSGKVEDALSEFDPAIEVRLEFNRKQLEQAAAEGMGMPRFGYWSYAPAPADRKWVEFTAKRENDNRMLLEIFQAENGITEAERNMADVGIVDYMENAATVDEALELLKQPSNRGVDAVRAIVIREPAGLADKFDEFSNLFGEGTTKMRVSFVVTVSSWEDQALGGFP